MFITTDIREFVKTAFQLRSIAYHVPSLRKVRDSWFKGSLYC